MARPELRAGVQADWVREISALTVAGPDDEVDAAQVLVKRLRSLAAVVHGTCPSSPTPCSCGLAAWPGGTDACALAGQLASPSTRPAGPVRDPAALAAAFIQAVVDAAVAVRLCRRVQHPVGSCWFHDAGAEADLCGAVLVAAHRLDRSSPQGLP